MQVHFHFLCLFLEHTASSLSHTSSAICLSSSGYIVFLLFPLGPLKSQTSGKIFHPGTHEHCVKDECRGQSCIPGLIDSESKRKREPNVFTASSLALTRPPWRRLSRLPPNPKTSQTSRSADSSPFHKVDDKYVERFVIKNSAEVRDRWE